MVLNRKPTPQEEKVLEFLIKKASVLFQSNWKEDLLVQPMEDGAMGSLVLIPKDQIGKHRSFGKQVSEFQFVDEDGVDVILSLNIDDQGNLFELDVWKTDFSKLIKWPSINF
ncbi:MAG: hypothetical protein E6Q66_10545 [Pedobacter sp.]|nr:MAG: hypothetical protein E6Q66_10545 [Pedobacter sp.]